MNQTTLNQNIQQIQKGIEAFHQFILDFMGFIEFLAQKFNELIESLSHK